MNAILDRDRILNIVTEGGVDIGALPAGVGLERLYAYHELTQSCKIRNFRIYSGTWPVLEVVM